MAGSACPGIGQGRWYSREEIEACLAEQRARPLIYRDIRKEL
jgi:hypothetical protein